MKLRIGIFFGGFSREREISFAGGRTVYDNLDKSLFDPIPLFVDSFGNFILLDWKNIYKGSIRDFYPPVEFVSPSLYGFQVYAESLGKLGYKKQVEIAKKLGKIIRPDELVKTIDFAFLALHGAWGEDGKVQKLLDDLGVPFSGSGVEASEFAMNKVFQKEKFPDKGFLTPKSIIISKKEWNTKSQIEILNKIKREISDTIVVKSANQGSSIGVSVLHKPKMKEFSKAIDKSFFSLLITKSEWDKRTAKEKIFFVRNEIDIRTGIGLPLELEGEIIYHPDILFEKINYHFSSGISDIHLNSIDSETHVIIEEFIKGDEFSCIVIEDENGIPVALPPTGIIKSGNIFDYRSKYLPGLVRKVTPIDLHPKKINSICTEAERLFRVFNFAVYARIDGIITKNGKIFLNDPNTTSGMLPSSFFFHQAAEIGLNPSQFLTFIIRTSIAARIRKLKQYKPLLKNLDHLIKDCRMYQDEKIKIAVLMGGYSSERHISVESGRNVYEKLSSSEKYQPIPIFLTGNDKLHRMFQIPVNSMLKDHADDIREKVLNYCEHPIVKIIKKKLDSVTKKYGLESNSKKPVELSFKDLPHIADGVFIALHGRPGEDGSIQRKLIKAGLPYNGSSPDSSAITIDKFQTNEILKSQGYTIPKHWILRKKDWVKNKKIILKNISNEFHFPLIAKPVDDGCSTSVKKIDSPEDLVYYAQILFRNKQQLPLKASQKLKIKLNEEMPVKDEFLIEELVTKGNAKHFLEITGGMLTHLNTESKTLRYEIFEPSETLSDNAILSLEEKFLAGEGQNITPARFHAKFNINKQITVKVKKEIENAAKTLNIEGYSRIDAFVKVNKHNIPEVIFIEANSLPGMTPATCIFHQCALNGYKPYDFIDKIIEYGMKKLKVHKVKSS